MVNSGAINIGVNEVVYCHPRSIVPINGPGVDTQKQDDDDQHSGSSRRDPVDRLEWSDWIDKKT